MRTGGHIAICGVTRCWNFDDKGVKTEIYFEIKMTCEPTFDLPMTRPDTAKIGQGVTSQSSFLKKEKKKEEKEKKSIC